MKKILILMKRLVYFCNLIIEEFHGRMFVQYGNTNCRRQRKYMNGWIDLNTEEVCLTELDRGLLSTPRPWDNIDHDDSLIREDQSLTVSENAEMRFCKHSSAWQLRCRKVCVRCIRRYNQHRRTENDTVFTVLYRSRYTGQHCHRWVHH